MHAMAGENKATSGPCNAMQCLFAGVSQSAFAGFVCWQEMGHGTFGRERLWGLIFWSCVSGLKGLVI